MAEQPRFSSSRAFRARSARPKFEIVYCMTRALLRLFSRGVRAIAQPRNREPDQGQHGGRGFRCRYEGISHESPRQRVDREAIRKVEHLLIERKGECVSEIGRGRGKT